MESVLLRLQGRRVHNEEDKLALVEAKDGRFSFTCLYKELESGMMRTPLRVASRSTNCCGLLQGSSNTI